MECNIAALLFASYFDLIVRQEDYGLKLIPTEYFKRSYIIINYPIMKKYTFQKCGFHSIINRILKFAFATVLVITMITQNTVANDNPYATHKQPLESLLNPDGTLDLSTGFTGSLNTEGWSMITGPDGVPNFVPVDETEVNSYIESLSDDENWDVFQWPGIDNVVHSIAILGSDLYIGGRFTSIGNILVNNIAKWDGSTWSEVGGGTNGGITTLAVSGNDLYVGGKFYKAGDVFAKNIAKWDGSTWSALGDGVNISVSVIAINSGDVYVGGQFGTAGNILVNNIAKWDGASWSAMGTGTNGTVRDIAISSDYIYICGQFTQAGGVNANHIAKWDGINWSGLGSGINLGVSAILIDGSNLYAAGQFTIAGGVNANNIAKWDGSSWSAVGSDIMMYGSISELAKIGNDIYAAGTISKIGDMETNHVAKWNGSTWTTLGNGTNDYITTLNVIEGELYVGGYFTTAGNVDAAHLAKWNGSSWFSVVERGNGKGSVNGNITAIAINGNDIFVAGEFTRAGGVYAKNIAKWDGNSWSSLGSGIEDGIIKALAINGNYLYVAGAFRKQIGLGEFATGLVKWDGSSWSDVGEFNNYGAYTLLSIGNELYVGGLFTEAGGVNAKNIAKWDGSTWSSLGNGTSGYVNALAADANSIYASGSFTDYINIVKWDGTNWLGVGDAFELPFFPTSLLVMKGNLYAGGCYGCPNSKDYYIAKWDGNSWIEIGNGPDNHIFALATDGINLYAGGKFINANGLTTNYIAKWDGNFWSALGSGLNNEVITLATKDNKLYVGGKFSTAGNKVSKHLALWNIPDNEPPILINVPSNVTVDCHTIPSPAIVTAEDYHDGSVPVIFSETESSGSGCPEVKVITRTWTASDAAGNTTSQTQIIRVEDTTSPSITLPSDKTVVCGDPTDPSATGMATAIDNCEGEVTITYSDNITNVTCPDVSIIERTWTATDACGNSISADQSIRIVDFLPPMITCSPSVTIECDESTDPANTGMATAIDRCDPSVNITYSDEFVAGCGNTGVITRTWTATDDCGNSSSCVQTITIDDETPPLLAGIPDGSLIVPNDPGQCGAVVEYPIISATDNCSGNIELLIVPASGSFFQLENNPSVVTVTATDECGNSSTASFDVIVTNEIPAIGTITAPIAPVEVGSTVDVSATFIDNNLFEAYWDWGDFTNSGGTIVGQTITGNHQYFEPGVYTLTLTVTDHCGETDTEIYQYVVIYDPVGGFVNGAGWINSPPGAYSADPSLEGKANFGFVSKYQKGSSVPMGNTQFRFRAGDLNFSSDSYYWLVIAGPRAMFKGEGQINGIADYQFLVSAIDGQVNGGGGLDKFRIKIWDKNNNDVIVYDNQLNDAEDAAPEMVIEGGSITIHDGKDKSARIANSGLILEGSNEFKEILIYPNPVRDIVTLELSSGFESENLQIHLYSLTGLEMISENQVFIKQNSIEIDLTEIPAGLYLMLIENEKNLFKYKLTKL